MPPSAPQTRKPPSAQRGAATEKAMRPLPAHPFRRPPCRRETLSPAAFPPSPNILPQRYGKCRQQSFCAAAVKRQPKMAIRRRNGKMMQAVLGDQKSLACMHIKTVKTANAVRDIVENIGAAHPRSHRARLLRRGKAELRNIQVGILCREKADLRHLPAPFPYHCSTAVLYCKRKA